MNIFSEWHQIAGVTGTAAYLGSYFLIQVGTISVRSYKYCLINIAAASLVGVSLIYEFNLASALIQISWIMISLIGVTKLTLQRKRTTHRRRRRNHVISVYPGKTA